MGPTDEGLTRLIDLDVPPGEFKEGLGVVAVAPALYTSPLG